MRTFAPWLAMLLACGCDAILSVNDYVVGPGESEPLGSIYTPACETCIDERCRTQLDACDANDECRDLLACIQRCRDPGCVLSCAAPTYGPLGNWPIEEVESCLVRNCWDSCPIGRDFTCRDYSWPAVYEVGEPVSVDVKVFDLVQGLEGGVEGVEVTPCVDTVVSQDCNDGFTQISDAGGFVELEVPMGTTGFTGSIRGVDPETPEVTFRTFSDIPFTDFWDINYVTVDRSGAGRSLYQIQSGKPFDGTVGGVQLELSDCNTWPAGGVVLTEPAENDDYWVYYPVELTDSDATPQTVGEGERDDNGELIEDNLNFIYLVGPPGDTDIELRTVDGALYRRTTITLYPGRLDTHRLLPQAE